MLDLFPLIQKQLFKLPDLAIDQTTHADTYKGLFMGDLMALNLSAKRTVSPATYVRHEDGSANLSIADTVLDVSAFYMFAHKALVSSIFIFAKTIPQSKAQGISTTSYTRFVKDVLAKKNEVYEQVYKNCGKKLTWAQRAIVDKRDDLVQHWQGNTSNQFFTMVCAWDVPYLVYYNPKTVSKINDKKVNYIYSQVTAAVKESPENPDSLQKIAWMEARHPLLSTQLQSQIEDLADNNIFIALPVTFQLVSKLDETIACLLEEALKIAKT